jgi:hypothetical protein
VRGWNSYRLRLVFMIMAEDIGDANICPRIGLWPRKRGETKTCGGVVNVVVGEREDCARA